jgi:bacterioferritin
MTVTGCCEARQGGQQVYHSSCQTAKQKKARLERSTMKGDANVIALLNQVLKAELTAINQYFLHAEMCENWGYERMAKHTRAESIEEMTHAEKLMERILLLDGTPNMSDYFKINIGQTVKAQLENDLNLEYEAVKRLNGGIQTCVKAGDNGSRELLEKILKDEEHHVDWLEGQVHAIGEMGIENYLAQQLHKNEEE